jgi:hypothetical protein
MPKRDFDMLASRILLFAKKALSDGGLVIPMGAAISPGGEFRPIQRIYPPHERVAAPELLNEILSVFRNLARDKEARALAWCVDMRVVPPGATDKTDAVVLFCEASTGEANVLITPYRGAPGPGTTFAAAYLQSSRPQIFVE